MSDGGDWIVFRILGSRAEAEVVRQLLESNGILTSVEADDAGGMRPELAFSRGVKLLIQDGDRVAAESVIANVSEPEGK